VNIKDYFLIGDLHTSALVSNKGSVDWFCVPHFDSPSMFARLLDKSAGDFSLIAEGWNSKSKYLKDTAILETTFTKGNKKFTLRDFMLPRPKKQVISHFLVRKIRAKSDVEITFRFNPKPEYGKKQVNIKQEQNRLIFPIGDRKVFLRIPQNSKIKKTKQGFLITFKLKANQSDELVLEYTKTRSIYRKGTLEKRTINFWKKWISQGKFFDYNREDLIRSAITLKLMQFYKTGALIAAPTTSLPESIGNGRNWDYRYVWIRDATFTLYAFYVLGYKEEAKKFFKYIESIAKKCKDNPITLKPVYTIEGKTPPKETTLNLEGYKNSKPVRLGNAAADQFQLDIYGSLIDSYYFMLKKGFRISKESKQIILNMAERIERHWKEKDDSIWEFRSRKRHYTYSKIMAWVGINRTIKLCDRLNIPKKKKEHLKKLEKEIKDWIWKNCYDEKTKSLKQSPDSKSQDSINYLAVLLHFLNKNHSLTEEIIKNTNKELVTKNLFVYRYKSNDKLKGKEGAFILSTFWYLSALAKIKQPKKAEALMKELEKIIPQHGLIAEEINPKNLNYLGNYPQAFSHMGYIMSSYYINKYLNNP